MANTPPAILIRPRKVLLALLVTVVALVILSIWGQYLRYFQRFVDIRAWMEFGLDLLNHKFYMDAESNIPTWFNTALLLAISGLFFVVGLQKVAAHERFRIHWLGAAALFLLMSVDELSILHEMLIDPVRGWLGLRGWFYFGWVIPGMAFLLLVAIAYFAFFLHLEPRFKVLFSFSLFTYFLGAIGAEMLGGRVAAAIGQRNFTYAVYASLEESLEMIGASFLIYSLLTYLQEETPELRFHLA